MKNTNTLFSQNYFRYLTNELQMALFVQITFKTDYKSTFRYSLMILWTKYNVYQKHIWTEEKSAKDYASDLIGALTGAEKVRSKSTKRTDKKYNT